MRKFDYEKSTARKDAIREFFTVLILLAVFFGLWMLLVQPILNQVTSGIKALGF